jgi:hypothetical protein
LRPQSKSADAFLSKAAFRQEKNLLKLALTEGQIRPNLSFLEGHLAPDCQMFHAVIDNHPRRETEGGTHLLAVAMEKFVLP